jgi:ZIP family zinc transporter
LRYIASNVEKMCQTGNCQKCQNISRSVTADAAVVSSARPAEGQGQGQGQGQKKFRSQSKSAVQDAAVHDTGLGDKVVDASAQADDWLSYLLLVLVVAVTVFSFPREVFEGVSLQKVWYFGWITAVSTGLGVVPFYFVGAPNKAFMGLANGCAAGMMVAASGSLMWEGVTFDEVSGFFGYHSLFRALIGLALGVSFILATKTILEKYEDIKFGAIEGAGAQKIMLIVFVMTLHSMTEGIGIGVSFGGRSGAQLGQLISLSLALHNVPEGLAVALVLTSRGVPKIRTALWCIFTSLPQPVMAIPAFMFVERFLPILPVGLGFASGAMLYVAVFELFAEAVEDTSMLVACSCAAASFSVMIFAQEMVKMAL